MASTRAERAGGSSCEVPVRSPLVPLRHLQGLRPPQRARPHPLPVRPPLVLRAGYAPLPPLRGDRLKPSILCIRRGFHKVWAGEEYCDDCGLSAPPVSEASKAGALSRGV